ncbi:DUF6931 family protein [Motiliproteus sp. MSK22-1]|uniref:DUF6931 family protein n=1 Tax=Motiliproteus sp. MSK22-1 TaxID=1897630 RepID=UPI0009771328|nr:hypothetical protein [Motiliproteus sp. MSK22-1]OMH38672.1 hypothetical protein BGP75_06425 [Motiliproteus sp. MSK22-1]
MNDKLQLKKITAGTAKEICDRYDPSPEICSRLDATLSPGELLGMLQTEDLYADALQFMVFALPKRETVWLACLAARQSLSESPSKEDLSAIEYAEKWVFEPNEENHQVLKAAAEATGMSTAAGMAAAAGNWADGSLTSKQSPPVTPPEELTKEAAWAAIILTLSKLPADQTPQNQKLFLDKAVDIANGGSGQ